jgi:hypothetical protein
MVDRDADPRRFVGVNDPDQLAESLAWVWLLCSGALLVAVTAYVVDPIDGARQSVTVAGAGGGLVLSSLAAYYVVLAERIRWTKRLATDNGLEDANGGER